MACFGDEIFNCSLTNEMFNVFVGMGTEEVMDREEEKSEEEDDEDETSEEESSEDEEEGARLKPVFVRKKVRCWTLSYQKDSKL